MERKRPQSSRQNIKGCTYLLGVDTKSCCVNLWTRRVITNFLVPETLCFIFYFNTERWVKSKASTATVILDRSGSPRLLFAGRVKAEGARRLLKR